jgi:hypothetical protein
LPYYDALLNGKLGPNSDGKEEGKIRYSQSIGKARKEREIV